MNLIYYTIIPVGSLTAPIRKNINITTVWISTLVSEINTYKETHTQQSQISLINEFKLGKIYYQMSLKSFSFQSFLNFGFVDLYG